MLARHTSTNVVLEGYPEVGFNYKLTDIQAAIGLVQMGKIDSFIAERRCLAQRYETLLSGDDRIELPCEPDGYMHVYQSYCVHLRDRRSQVAIMEAMAKRQIATRRIIANHLEPFYRRMAPDLVLPQTEEATRQTLLLPMFVGLSDQEQHDVAEARSQRARRV